MYIFSIRICSRKEWKAKKIYLCHTTHCLPAKVMFVNKNCVLCKNKDTLVLCIQYRCVYCTKCNMWIFNCCFYMYVSFTSSCSSVNWQNIHNYSYDGLFSPEYIYRYKTNRYLYDPSLLFFTFFSMCLKKKPIFINAHEGIYNFSFWK